MKKHLTAVLLTVLLVCLAAFSGCSLVRGFEKDLQINLKVNGEYRGTYTVNAFNNAIVPLPEQNDVPEGLMFYGWTPQENWQELGAGNVHLSQNKSVLRYDDVKDWVVGDEASVTVYAVFGEKPTHDLAIAWYNKPATSGLDENIIQSFTDSLNAYLVSQSYAPADMDIVIRGYSGTVGASCGQIKEDGDIDIMIGWANTNNLVGTGGLKAGADFLENNGNILINPDFEKGARYTARLNERAMTKLVYGWILETYAGEGGPTLDYLFDGNEPVDPEPPVDPKPPEEIDKITVTDKVLNVSIWNNSKGAWISAEQIEKLKTDFAAYLDKKVSNASALTLNWIVETDVTNVASLSASVIAAGNIDFVVGCGANVDTNKDGHLDNLVKFKVPASEYMAADRYVAVLNKDAPNRLAVMLYEFMTGSGFTAEAA